MMWIFFNAFVWGSKFRFHIQEWGTASTFYTFSVKISETTHVTQNPDETVQQYLLHKGMESDSLLRKIQHKHNCINMKRQVK